MDTVKVALPKTHFRTQHFNLTSQDYNTWLVKLFEAREARTVVVLREDNLTWFPVRFTCTSLPDPKL